ncbi:MAG TPA: FAD-binding and (Fe-S)-binding domain-containing protein [Micropruina sp.]|nr:FAD-binding and (Fe-S)-binding domain-containing protein [Micropruina sp.]
MAPAAFDTSTLSRALYSSDASLYRVVPSAVCIPADLAELRDCVFKALADGTAITMRGAGTSCAGNAVGSGLVIDTRALNTIETIDPATGVAIVQTGVVQAQLDADAARHGLRFGPDPSTASRCTIGGMIGNNACGPRALGYGRTSDVITGLDLVTGTGESLTIRRGENLLDHPSPTLRALHGLVQTNLGVIRTEFGRLRRQISGYSLEHLLPEHGFDVAKFLVGSEGTLGVVTRAEVQLARQPKHSRLVLLGFGTLADAADAMPAVLPLTPSACEGLDARILEPVRRRRTAARVPPLPPGRGWLFVELTDDDPERLADRAATLAGATGALGAVVVDDPVDAALWWRLRADAAGYAGVALQQPAHPGWEDAAVPPERLGAYLRDFEALLDAHGLHGLPYGHFGEGCVHCRIDFPLGAGGGTQAYRRFIEAAADLVAAHGGSMSGEHGDGRARSELLDRMYSPAAIALFGAVKQLFDPGNLLNPGILVDPAPLDADLRLAALSHPLDALAADAHRCTGIGRCVAAGSADAMCPSFQVTRLEKDSTRGRARVLQELANGSLIDSPRSVEVSQALDLCLACKACASECPTGVDIAHDKARVLDSAYRGRVRPLTHYTLGWLPRWTRLVRSVPGLTSLANAVLRRPRLRAPFLALAGIDRRRGVPRLRQQHLSAVSTPPGGGQLGAVAVWADSFSRGFAGGHVEATMRVLADAGYTPQLIEERACCGLTWITTGQLAGAAARLRHSLDVLAPLAESGVPIVGVEPSCLSVWRDEAASLVDDRRVARVAEAMLTLAELLQRTPDWQPKDLSEHTIVVQPHCHHRAVLGWDADAALLRSTGAKVLTVTGCCGLAGNFGMERGHYETSVAVAGLHLLPALEREPEALVLADGFSCRTQITDLSGRTSMTLAELLDGGGAGPDVR